MKWARIVLVGIAVPAATLLLITLVVTGFAFKLAFEARGAPDQIRIGQFAAYFGRSYWSVLVILATVPATRWAARRIPASRALHGALIGVVVAGVGLLLGSTISVRTILAFVLTVAAGWLGGVLAARAGSA
ncbi:MAG: hypothetical protein NTY02_18135 [Acidobacteria bacterium]|nr:hypothetical protein [Acidobacteriota bacterium]